MSPVGDYEGPCPQFFEDMGLFYTGTCVVQNIMLIRMFINVHAYKTVFERIRVGV